MKYISLLLTALIILTACGKKTDPIPKDSLENVKPPVKVILKAQPEGFFIANNEDAFLIVEKAMRNGIDCEQYSPLVVLAPKTDYIDTDVKTDQEYSYKLVKRTIKYKLISEPRIFPVVYSNPPNVADSDVLVNGDSVVIDIQPTSMFIRMDVITGGVSIRQTAETNITLSSDEIVDNKISIKLMDIYGNSGDIYTINIEPEHVPEPIKDITGLTAAYLGGALRIVWDTVQTAEKYSVKVCEDVSCETVETQLPFTVYEKEFDKCLDITVNALNKEQRSKDAAFRYCK